MLETAPAPVVPAARPPLRRDPRAARWAGVCAGVAAHLRAPVPLVRAAFVVLTGVGGVGGLAYLLLWVLVPADPGEGAAAPAPSGHGVGAPAPSAPRPSARRTPPAPRWALAPRTAAQLVAGAALVSGGVAALARRGGAPALGRLAGGPVLLGALALAAGAAGWGLLDRPVRARWRARLGAEDVEGGRRLLTGAVVVAAGLVAVAELGDRATTLGPVLLAVAAVLGGAALLLAPAGLRQARALREERSARAAAAQREEVAAHLHDSVLQTLALLQRRSDDPVEVARLARAQERELREWLYGRGAAAGGPHGSGRGAAPGRAPATVASSVRAEVAAVEDASAVPVEVVTVGDRPLDEPARALVAALREAVLNAARHGRAPVQVYAEVTADHVEAFVRDHGDGFDLDAVPADRLGVRGSVVGRMHRAGGSAVLRRAPGGGTEVALRVPAAPVAVAPVPTPSGGGGRGGPAGSTGPGRG